MEQNIRNRAFSGVLWGFLEKFALQAFGFIQGVILARLLSPKDYGLVAMVGIFVMLSYAFIDSGFGTALIQKKEKREIDYSTVFVLNVSISLFISILLFLFSPLIANFYHEPLLSKIVKVYALLLFLSSFIAIQDVRLSILLEFKKKSIINVITTITSGLLAIVMAFYGWGVWSLILPQFCTIVLKAFLYWYYQRWLPGFKFSNRSSNELFGFGSKILATSILATIFENIYPLIIGKAFSAKALGYYSRADGYANLPPKTITSVIESVAYPIFSAIQENEEELKSAFKRMIRVSAYLIFPLMIWLLVLAKPLVVILVTAKWLPCVIYLQVLCLAKMWWHVQVLNLSLLKAKGRSDLFFKLEIVKKIMTLVILCATVPFGILIMCVGSVISSIISMGINSYYTGKLMNFGIIKQFKEMGPSLLYSLFMGVVIYLCLLSIHDLVMQLMVGTAIGIVFYVGISKLTGSKELSYLILLIHEKIRN